jgi:retron-type reverse transcriptase
MRLRRLKKAKPDIIKKYSTEEILKLGTKLTRFKERNLKTEHINYKVYHLLEDPFTYINAYSKVSKNTGALTKGVEATEETMSKFSLTKAEAISRAFRERRYHWSPTRRVMIPKPGKKAKRPMDTPTQKDRISQEAIRGLLESIYEPEFREFEKLNGFQCTNYGFRPGKSTEDALYYLKRLGKGTTYAIEGDISGAYNNVDHDILLLALRRRIRDKRFLKTINQLLKSGVMEEGSKIRTFMGTPQGGIVSPLLFNIYMFALDKYVYKEIIAPYNKSRSQSKPKVNPEYRRKTYRLEGLLRAIRKIRRDKESYKEVSSKQTLLLNKSKAKARKQLQKEIRNVYGQDRTSSQDIQSIPRKAVYARYADDWILLVHGPHEEALELKEKIKNFIETQLKMKLDEQKTLITHLTKGATFLGYKLRMWSGRQGLVKLVTSRTKKGWTRVRRLLTSRGLGVVVDGDRLKASLVRKKFCTPSYKPLPRDPWTILREEEIVRKYRETAVGLYNYYRICPCDRFLNLASYVLQYSCAFTLAKKNKTTTGKLMARHGKTLRFEYRQYTQGNTITKSVEFLTYAQYRNRSSEWQRKKQRDDPFSLKQNWRTSFKLFLDCVICGSEENVEMHHTNSLRKIPANKRENYSYVMRSLRRKQIPVCRSCHENITHGPYDKTKPIKLYEDYLKTLI